MVIQFRLRPTCLTLATRVPTFQQRGIHTGSFDQSINHPSPVAIFRPPKPSFLLRTGSSHHTASSQRTSRICISSLFYLLYYSPSRLAPSPLVAVQFLFPLSQPCKQNTISYSSSHPLLIPYPPFPPAFLVVQDKSLTLSLQTPPYRRQWCRQVLSSPPICG